ncbi:MAG: Ni/Fe hydrogenase subunit alpha [Candidatus Hodarchaeota archaeon]
MSREIVIEPVTRLEGHGKVTLKLGPGNKVEDVQFNILHTRFFEKFLEGRPAEHAPRIVPRICGICPIPHHLSSVKAVEAAWDITPPRPAYKLRELEMNAKQLSSHVLHIAALQLPDLLAGPLAPPEKRNVLAVINALPDIGKAVLKTMRFGQDLCAAVGGKAIHPVTGIPGGMSKPLDEDVRQRFLKQLPDIIEIGNTIVELGKKLINEYMIVIKNFAVVPTYYVGTVKPGDKAFTIWDGNIRVMDKEGNIASEFPAKDYVNHIGEYVPPHSMATHIYLKKAGYPEGIWRAGPLARLNVVEKMQTPWAQDLFQEFRSTVGRPCHMVFAYIWARIIETIHAAEKIKILLEDPEIVSKDVKLADVEPKAGNGVGQTEAPRGTLIHNYWTDDDGIITKANLIVATNNNIGGIELTLKTAAKQIFEDKIFDQIADKLPKPMI